MYFLVSRCKPDNSSSDFATNKVHFDSENLIGLAVWMACVLYSSLRTASSSSKIVGSDKMLVHDTAAGNQI